MRINLDPNLLDRARELQRRGGDVDRANADPCPGPLAGAFAAPLSTPIDATELGLGRIIVRPVTHMDWRRLRQLDHPLLRLPEIMAANGEAEAFTDEQQWEAVLLFTVDKKAAAELLGEGAATFKALAVEVIGERWPGPLVNLVWMLIMERMAHQWDCAVRFGAKASEEGHTTFFRDVAAKLRTGSAGSSNTSADSPPGSDGAMSSPSRQ